jgi:site-specific DNA recombinase
VWRVIRPEFREMLEDYEDGEIDGVIFYDIDRSSEESPHPHRPDGAF